MQTTNLNRRQFSRIAAAFTIRNCMSTIILMSKTTACLTLSLLNDEGRIAFCESDLVSIRVLRDLSR